MQTRCLSAQNSRRIFPEIPTSRRPKTPVDEVCALNCALVATSHYFSSQTSWLDASQLKATPLSTTVNGLTLQFLTGNGVFARRGLDEGSRLLLETLLASRAPNWNGAIGDLGCGWGAVGAFCAARWPQSRVFAVDINPRAVQLADLNGRRNELANLFASCGDGLGAFRNDSLDCIAVNPPVRAGNSVIEKLFVDAFQTLRSGGELWVVLRTAQGAKSWQKRLAAQFGECETVKMRAGYRVLKCVKGA